MVDPRLIEEHGDEDGMTNVDDAMWATLVREAREELQGQQISFAHAISIDHELQSGQVICIEWQKEHGRHFIWIQTGEVPQSAFKEFVFIVRDNAGDVAGRLTFQEDRFSGWYFQSAGGNYTLELCHE